MQKDEGLQRYLMRCEIEYVAAHGGGCIDWLAAECDTPQRAASFLRQLGFRIRKIVDEEPWPGEEHRWAETTGGILVFAGSGGLVARAAKTGGCDWHG